MAYSGNVMFPSQITVDDQVPADAVLSIYNRPTKFQKRVLTEGEIRAFSDFYNSLLGQKYQIDERRLPVQGMIVAACQFRRWYPAIVTRERFVGRNDAPCCGVLLTETGEELTSCALNTQIRYMSGKFLYLLPLGYVEDKSEPRRIIRVERRRSSDEEQVDYLSLIPLEDIVPFDYKFPEEPLLKPLLEKRRDSDGPIGNYLSVASIKIMITSVNTPEDFMFVTDRLSETNNWLQTKMCEIYTPLDTDEYLVPSPMVVENLPVVVLSSSGKMWWRAYVKSILHGDLCLVQPVDGDETIQVYKSQLRFVHRSIAHVPRLGFHGKLAGFLPPNRTWSEDAKRVFTNLTKMGDDYIRGLISYFMMDGTAAMYLWTHDKNNKDMWIGDEMTARLLAKPDPTPPEKHPARAKPKHNEQMALLVECLVADGLISPV